VIITAGKLPLPQPHGVLFNSESLLLTAALNTLCSSSSSSHQANNTLCYESASL
jgi:hypothetical protein